MYCIKCGVEMADTEPKCPLCGTAVCHPDFIGIEATPLYPTHRVPKTHSNSKVLSGALIILFLIPLLVCLVADWQANGRLDWFGYVAGAAIVVYVALILPLWFRKPNPVIFVPCNFATVGLYLMYINFVTEGNWFLTFALPVVVVVCLISCALVTLLYYLHKGVLYIVGGGFMATGLLVFMIECLLKVTFELAFIGWSFYPLAVLFVFGSLCIYLAINDTARELMERKLFF